jgi:hypothetical protein
MYDDDFEDTSDFDYLTDSEAISPRYKNNARRLIEIRKEEKSLQSVINDYDDYDLTA